jgi:hypothetical protein
MQMAFLPVAMAAAVEKQLGAEWVAEFPFNVLSLLTHRVEG